MAFDGFGFGVHGSWMLVFGHKGFCICGLMLWSLAIGIHYVDPPPCNSGMIGI